jgi:hypothetical protein
VSKGRRAVTHTDEHRANHTPVRNQFKELSEHQEDPTTTPSLAPRKLIVEFTRQSPATGITGKLTDPSDSSSSNGNDNIEDDNTDTGSIGSTESFDTMTNITSD